MNPSPLRGYIPTLDGWRAIAVTLVLVFHSNNGDKVAWWHNYPLGHLGVGIFFALSGFLICIRLLRDYEASGAWNLKAFYLRRAFRILPAAWLVLATIASLKGFGINLATPAEILCGFGFVRNYFPLGGMGGYYTAHFWSLAVEEHFYLMFPLALSFFGNHRALWAFPIVSILDMLIRDAIPYCLDTMGVAYRPGFFFWSRTHVRLDALLWGCWWALLVHVRPGLVRSILGRRSFAAGLLTVAATFPFKDPVGVYALILPVIVLGTATNPQLWVSRVLETRVFRLVGRYSYGIYLWQQLFFVRDITRLVPALATLQIFPINLLATLILAIVMYHLVERPLVRLGHRLSRRVTRNGSR